MWSRNTNAHNGGAKTAGATTVQATHPKSSRAKWEKVESEFRNVCVHLCVLAREKKLGGHTTELEAGLTHIPLNRPHWLCTVLADTAIARRECLSESCDLAAAIGRAKKVMARTVWEKTQHNQYRHLYPFFIHSLALFSECCTKWCCLVSGRV